MAHNALIQVRVDEELKETADALFNHLGFDTPTAIRIFLRQAILRDGLPFDVSCTPNADTVSALIESRQLSRDPNAKKYSNFSELLEEVKTELRNEV